MGACPIACQGRWEGRGGTDARRSPEDPRLVRDGQTALGRRHPQPPAAPGGPARLSAAARAERIVREPSWPLRDTASAALVIPRDARGIRVQIGSVPLLRGVPRRRTAGERSLALATLPPRVARRDHNLARRTVADPRRKARTAAATVWPRVPLFRAGALVHQDARPTPRRWQYDHPGALLGIAGRSRDADRHLEVLRQNGEKSRLEPQAPGVQHRPADGPIRALPCGGSR